MDTALRDCRGSPLLVLGLARPEVHDIFPKIWSSRRSHELRLRKIGAKARASLVRHVLGDVVSEATTTRLSALSDGNAFYLEELDPRGGGGAARHLARDRGGHGAIEDRATRRRGAAHSAGGERLRGDVLGGGVAALLDPGPRAPALRGELSRLVEGKLVMRVRESRFPGEEELRFRHALLREGAYSMLTEEDRALGHRLAGEWLARRGEQDPSVLAEHFERGGDLARACHFHARAAEWSFTHFDLDGVLSHVERGVACGASGEVLLELRSWQLMAHNFRWSFTEQVLRLAETTRALARHPHDPLLTMHASIQMILSIREDVRHAEEIRSLARENIEFSLGPTVFSTVARVCLAGVHLLEGDPVSAEAEARQAYESGRTMPFYRLQASAVLATALVRQGRASEAREVAERELVQVEAQGGAGVIEGMLHLAVADPAFRRSFLEDVPAHRRTLEMADEMVLGETS